MNTRSSTRPGPSKAPGSADSPAEPTHSEVHVETPHVERPQDLALPAYAPRMDAAHADAPHDDAPRNPPPHDNTSHATAPSTSHSRDRISRLQAMITAAADEAFTLA